MDPLSHRMVNVLVGNSADAATLEVTLQGPDIQMEQDTVIAVAGSDMQPRVDGAEVSMNAPVRCRKGSVLTFHGRTAGTRLYIAFDGGVEVPRVLGSRSTHVASRLGGINGGPVRAGDQLPLGAASSSIARVYPGRSAPTAHADEVRLRVLPGPQSESFPALALDALEQQQFVVSPQSDRMGYRLTGGAALRNGTTGAMISDVTFTGALQVPPSGDPILLMADRQTTGGYPQIAVVISADLPAAAQLAPGDRVRFVECTRAEALAALVAQEGPLLAIH
jgi:antagonist of KipI